MARSVRPPGVLERTLPTGTDLSMGDNMQLEFTGAVLLEDRAAQG